MVGDCGFVPLQCVDHLRTSLANPCDAPKIAPIVYIWSDPLIQCCIILINVLFVRISVGAFATCDTNLKPEAA